MTWIFIHKVSVYIYVLFYAIVPQAIHSGTRQQYFCSNGWHLSSCPPINVHTCYSVMQVLMHTAVYEVNQTAQKHRYSFETCHFGPPVVSSKTLKKKKEMKWNRSQQIQLIQLDTPVKLILLIVELQVFARNLSLCIVIVLCYTGACVYMHFIVEKKNSRKAQWESKAQPVRAVIICGIHCLKLLEILNTVLV